MALILAKLRMSSAAGTGVRPSIRVRITVWLTSGSTYSFFKAAAAAQKELTPGVTRKGIAAASKISICSRIAP